MSPVRVLCYGDSNTYGFNAVDGSRFPENTRWPGVMQRRLGDGFTVVEEGYNGRTIADVYPFDSYLNGTSYLPGCLALHNPLDLVIIYLGINDLFVEVSMSVDIIAAALKRLIVITRNLAADRTGKPAAILIVAPPPVNAGAEGASLYTEKIEESRLFAAVYKGVARKYDCLFMDAGEVVQPVLLDGVHLDGKSHVILGRHIASLVKEQLPGIHG